MPREEKALLGEDTIGELRKQNRDLQKHNTELVLRVRELAMKNHDLEAVLKWFRDGCPGFAKIMEVVRGDESGS